MRSRLLQIALFIAFALLSITPKFSQAQYAISTVAGGGPNNLAELSASIGYPASVAFDAHGNTYIADPYSSHIFEVNASTGVLTAVAGNGTLGYSGDGGPATSAALNAPEGVFLDSSNNIFIADTGNCLIREVTGGTISTVAGDASVLNPCGYGGDGGPATAAQLYDPFGVFVDGSGNIFIADTDNCLIREVSGGNISTVAGNPLGLPLPCGYSGDGGSATTAQLDEPFGVFVDKSGNIFIADSYNNLIRVVNPGTAAVIIAGVTIEPGDINKIAGINYEAGDGSACNIAGDGGAATSAYLCLPYGIFVDSSENIFITDTDNFAIRKIATAFSADTITTPVGVLGQEGFSPNGTAATSADLNYPSNVVLDAGGDIFIADTDNSVIREVAASTSQIQTTIGNTFLAYSGDGGAAVNAELSDPAGVANDAAGNFYIADSDNSVIRVVNTGTSSITINGVTIPAGDVQTIVGNGTDCALSLTPTPPFCGDGGPALSAMLNSPESVFVDASGNIFIADTNDSLIRVVNTGTATITIAGVSVAPGAIETVAGNGIPGYLGDTGLATLAELNGPFGVFVDSAENIFIADTSNDVIREVTASSGVINTVVGTGVECTDPATACGDGGLATAAQLSSPAGVFVDVAEDIFIADTFDSRIREVTASNGIINTVAGNGGRGYSGDGAAATAANLDTPYGIFVDLSGDIFIADTDNAAIREVVAATGFIQTVAGIAPVAPLTTATPGFSGDGGQATSAELNSPQGVFGTASGALYIADTDNQRIRELVAAVFVTVAPNPVNVVVGAEQQFTATVTGSSNTAVTWQVNGIVGGSSTLGIGTISTTGLYQAPTTVPTPATVTITAISAADGTTSGSAQATIVTASTNVTVTVSSGGATQVYTGTTQQFSATVTGSTNQAVNWYVEGSFAGDTTFGTIDSSGLYTAPTTVPTPATITVTAYSQAASNALGSTQITIIAAPSAAEPAPQTISPGSSATYNLTLNENTGAPGQAMTLSCLQSTLPPSGTCAFTPPTITPGSQAVPFSLTISVPSTSASLNHPKNMRLTLFCTFLPLAGILFIGTGLRDRRRRWLHLLAVAFFLILLNACGGSGSSSTGTGSGPQTYNVKVQGTTAAQPNPVTITIAGLTVE
ncbi:MAG: hypothetical protein ACLQLC_08980 [Candidatus Sulfotelmatobacter sp.]